MAVSRHPFGQLEQRTVTCTRLENARGMQVDVIDYGAAVVAVRLPVVHPTATMVDVVLGFDTLEAYVAGGAFFGATVGRCANRIEGAHFSLEGRAFDIAANDAPHHLHGGPKGWDKVLWESSALGPSSVELRYVSSDGEEGYPGQVDASVVYTLTDADELLVHMTARTTAVTLVNMAHHSYWNLAGHDAGSIETHELELMADAFTPGRPVVPYGESKPVDGTPFDFRRSKPIGRDIGQVAGEPPGYDHNFVVRGDAGTFRPVARLVEPASGRAMELWSDQPGVQFYTGNFLDGSLSGKGARYGFRSGLCLETQAHPNAANVPAWRAQVVLHPGQTYEHRMSHRFHF